MFLLYSRHKVTQLFCFPQMFLLYSRHKVTELVHRKLEVLDNFMKRRCEWVVIRVREDIVDPPVLEEIFLDAKHKIENGISRVLVSVGLLDFLNKHAKGEVKFVSPQLENVSLEGLLVLSLSSLFLELSILAHDPMLPSVHPVGELQVMIGVRTLLGLLLNCLNCCLLLSRRDALLVLEPFHVWTLTHRAPWSPSVAPLAPLVGLVPTLTSPTSPTSPGVRVVRVVRVRLPPLVAHLVVDTHRA